MSVVSRDEKKRIMNPMNNKPEFIHRDGLCANREYVQWLCDVKQRYRQAQVKAMLHVNTALLEFYWSLGRDLASLHPEEHWGKGIVRQFALDMRNAFPNETGFSDTNIKYMRQWYSFYSEKVIISQQPVGQLPIEFSQQAVDQLEMPEVFGRIPWGHHVCIFSKTNSLEEALFYIGQTLEGGWSRSVLEGKISQDLYKAHGAAITNFDAKLPASQSQIAQEILKDPYNFEFLTVKENYDERELEDALVTNITRFLLELGEGFAFVGRQKELRMPDGTTFFPDLIFYHIPQKRYVVVELKAVKFAPEFAGKINFYVTAADNLLRGKDDNATVGLIICPSYDKTIVEWSLQGIEKPLGVASYQLKEVVERTMADLSIPRD